MAWSWGVAAARPPLKVSRRYFFPNCSSVAAKDCICGKGEREPLSECASKSGARSAETSAAGEWSAVRSGLASGSMPKILRHIAREGSEASA